MPFSSKYEHYQEFGSNCAIYILAEVLRKEEFPLICILTCTCTSSTD